MKTLEELRADFVAAKLAWDGVAKEAFDTLHVWDLAHNAASAERLTEARLKYFAAKDAYEKATEETTNEV